MNRLALVLVGCVLLAACAVPPAALDAAATAMRYRCVSGQVITATYLGTDAARLRYRGREYRMEIAISGSGARYVGEGLEWWTRGSGAGSSGMLSWRAADGTSGELIESCSGE